MIMTNQDYIRYWNKYFNGLKRNIDRKYAIYDFLKDKKKEFGYTVEKMIGSNQILVYHKEKLIYNSDNEKQYDCDTSEKMIQFLLNILVDLIIKSSKSKTRFYNV